MSRTYRRKGCKHKFSFFIDLFSILNNKKLSDWYYHSDMYRSFLNKKLLKYFTKRHSRREPIIYDENNDEVTTKYKRHGDPWDWD